MIVKDIVKLSRPRFWLYLAGPYLVGFVFAGDLFALLSAVFILHFLFFLFPANILLYGVNDLFDRDTDASNEKKGGKEVRLQQAHLQRVRLAVMVSALASLPLVGVFFSLHALIVWLVFLSLSFFYSVPPVRFKARPVVDSLSNVLYVMPGVLAYVHVTGSFPPFIVILAAWVWVAAMHLFSAIPDIAADRRANLKTTAILLGHDWSLVACTLLWSVTFFVVLSFASWWSWLFMIYPLFSLAVLLVKELPIKRAYWWFPSLNAFMGFVLFLGGVFG